MIYLLPLFSFGIMAVLVFRRWRFGVFLIFFWLLLEDIVRRLVPGQPAQIMLIKDVLIALTYLSFLLHVFFTNKKIWKPAFGGALFLFAGFVVINILNPNSPGLLFGLIGLRSYLWYLPLIFLGYHMFEKEEKVLKFCRVLAYLAIPLFVFAVFQYVFYDSGLALIRPLNEGAQTHSFQIVTDSFIKSGSMPLLPSVFGMGQRYGRFSMLLFFLGLGLLLAKNRDNPSSSKKTRFLLLMSVFSAFLGIVLSGARTAFVLTSIGSVLFFFLAVEFKDSKAHRLWSNRRVWIFSLIAITLVLLPIILLFGNSAFFQISSFYFAFKERMPWVFEGLRNALAYSKFFGMGTGTFSQGLYEIPGGTDWISLNKEMMTEGFRFETGFGKIIFELGILGMIIFYLFWISLFYRMKKEMKLLRNSNLRNLGLGIFIFSFLTLFWYTFVHHQILGDATTLVILWFFLGVFFGLSRITKHESGEDTPE